MGPCEHKMSNANIKNLNEVAARKAREMKTQRGTLRNLCVCFYPEVLKV